MEVDKDEQAIQRKKKHVKNAGKKRNCTDRILQDLRYRKIMHYDAQTKDILFRYPQRVYENYCSESKEELRKVVESHGSEYSSWVI